MIPDEPERLADLATEVGQRAQDLAPTDAPAEVPRVAPRGRAIERRRQEHDARDFPSLAPAPQDGSRPDGRPRGADAGPKRVTRLVRAASSRRDSAAAADPCGRGAG
ncbi:MAG: hypothetical protein ACREON_04015, partial [Gemmatimonadaceae bacterium]